MLKYGQVLEVDIETVNSRGQGIARFGGDRFVLFVPGALPGEVVRGRVAVLKKSYGVLQVESIEEAHEARITPACPWFGMCGGCAVQHASYELQLELKSSILDQALKRVGGISNVSPERCEASPAIWTYRNKASFPVAAMDNGAAIGFYREGTHNLVRVDQCPVLEPSLGELISPLTELLKETGVEVYDPRKGSGLLRHIVVRTRSGSGKAMIVAVLNTPPADRPPDRIMPFLHSLADMAGESEGIVVNYNTSPGNTIFGGRSIPITGTGLISESIGPFSLSYGPTSFFQVNTRQAAELFRAASQHLDMAGSSKVLELYSGTGALTLYIARGRQRVVAVEEWPESTDFLRRNMEENGLRGLVDPVGMTAERAVKALSGKSFDAVVLDPPRKGCSMEVLSGLTKILPPLIIYTSCNPATLARDASFLCANGYRLREVRAFDMFPQTSHVECLSVFERGNQFPLSSPSRLAFV